MTLHEQITAALKAAKSAAASAEKVRQESRAIVARLDHAVADGFLGPKQAAERKAELRQRCQEAAEQAKSANQAARAILAEGRAATTREHLFRSARHVPAIAAPPDHADSIDRLLHEMRGVREELTRARVTAELRAASPQELIARARDAAARQDAATVQALLIEHDRRWRGREYDGGAIGGPDQLAAGGAIGAAEQAIRFPDTTVKARVDLGELERVVTKLDTVEQALARDDARAHDAADGAELTDLIAGTDDPRDAVRKRDAARQALDQRAKAAVDETATAAFTKMLAGEDDDDPPPAAAQGDAPDGVVH